MATNAAKMLSNEPEESDEDEDEIEYGNSDQVSANKTAHEFFAVLLQAARSSHELHLSTRSFAEHMALDTLYSELPGHVDGLVESYQGVFGLITEYPANPPMPDMGNCVKFVTDLRAYVKAKRKEVSSESEHQNDIDGIMTLLNQTLNKLKFLS